LLVFYALFFSLFKIWLLFAMPPTTDWLSDLYFILQRTLSLSLSLSIVDLSQ
jgi:hypothetical protein